MAIRVTWTSANGHARQATFGSERLADEWERELNRAGLPWRAEAV